MGAQGRRIGQGRMSTSTETNGVIVYDFPANTVAQIVAPVAPFVAPVEPPGEIVHPVVKGEKGDPGPAGPPGQDGQDGQGKLFEFTQTSPLSTWTINHNFGYRPNVEVMTLGGAVVWAEVVHLNNNQVVIYHDQPMSGIAVCT